MLCRPLAIALLSLLMAACLTHPPQMPTPVTDWQRYIEHQQQLDHWQLSGKLGFKSPQHKSGSANVNWQQQQQQYAVRLSGALGIGTTHIHGDPQQVVMQRGKQQHTAASSEQLTWQLLGVPLSVEDLTYWVRGIPNPARPVAVLSHNSNGALDTLSQGGWQLQFSRYTDADKWRLPGRITGRRGEMSFKLIIKRWRPETER